MADPRQAELLNPMTCDVMDLVDEHHADLPGAERWPKALRELVDVLASYNERVLRMSPKAAADDAIERVVVIADYLGGKFVYLPRGDVLRVAARDAVIYRLHGRLPVTEIARLFDLGEIRVYAIVATEKQRAIARMQGRLFDEPPAGGGA